MIKEFIIYNEIKIDLNFQENSNNDIIINKFTHKLIIEGIPEHGLLLFIPFEYKNKFTLENIKEKLFIL